MSTRQNRISRKQLLAAWLAMMVLGAGTVIAGRVKAEASLGPFWAAALMVIAGLKARLILAYFLGLRTASRDWNSAFTTMLVIILAMLLLMFYAGNWLPALQ